MLSMIALLASAFGTEPATVRPVYLRVESLVQPIGLDETRPRLSWELEGSRRGAGQTAYQVQAASSRELLITATADLWDTGKVGSTATLGIEYAGRVPAAAGEVWWRVRVWDEADRASEWSEPSFWIVGPGREWRARWITDPADYPEPLPARNGYHSELAEGPDQPKWVQIELPTPTVLDGVRLWPARPYDWQPDTPGFLFPVRYRIEVATDPEGRFEIVAERESEDQPAPEDEPLTIRFPVRTVRSVRLTATRLRMRDPGHYGLALAEMEGLHGDAVVTRGAPVRALDSIESGAWSRTNLTDGDLRSHPARDTEALPALMLRKEFELEAVPRKAVLFATAMGIYEVRINGRRVGDHVLAPEWTDYRKRVQYQGYDVSGLLRKGPNTIAVMLGDGWYAGRIGLLPGRGHYGRRPAFLAQIHGDGSPEPIVWTDGSWRATTRGPIRSADILDGEVYDARMELPGWDGPGFSDSGWTLARETDFPGTIVTAQTNEPIRVTRELQPVALTEPKPGCYVFDLGQNMVGWVRLQLRAPQGTTVRLRHAEVLDEDGGIYTANLRGAAQTDVYLCRGTGEETFEPHFTYHGFRYVEVTGLPYRPEPGDLVGRVFHSSAPEVGTFECSHPDLNRLWQNIVWTQRANLMSTPTDCPQRDERLGWMGDIQAFGRTACFVMDLAAFFTKWLQDVRDAQTEDGRFPDFAPNPLSPQGQFCGAPAWGDAGVFLPMLVHETYGDRRVLERHYENMARWVEFIHRHNPDGIWRNNRGNDYNDWLNGDTLIAEGWPTRGGEVPKELFATAFWAQSVRLTAEAAHALGKEEDARRFGDLWQSIREAFQRGFLQPDGSLLGDTQAGYALALHFDLLPEQNRRTAVERMIAGIEAYGGRLSTGIQSTHRLMLELTRAGRSDVAYRLLLQRGFPGWLYSLDNGATTIWERWDGYVKGRGFQNPGMNSFNHWAFGAVGEWMMRVIGGLNPAPSLAPGQSTVWQSFRVEPKPGGGLEWARATYRSVHGLIEVSWRQEKGTMTLQLRVPPGCEAHVTLPGAASKSVQEGGKPLGQAEAVQMLGPEGTDLRIRVGSGTFEFRW